MAQNLITDITITALPPATSVTINHNITNWDNAPLVPFEVRPDRATPIVASNITATQVTFTNPEASDQSAIFRAWRYHSEIAPGSTPALAWKGGGSGGGGSGGTQFVFVFRPGGVQAGNVYTSWSDLYADAILVNGYKWVEVDTSFAPAAMDPGNYDLSQFMLRGNPNRGVPGVSFETTLTVPAGVTWSAPPPVVDSVLTIDITANAPVLTVGPDKFFVFGLFNGSSIQQSVGATPTIRVAGTPGHTAVLGVLLDDSQVNRVAPVEVFQCDTADSALRFILRNNGRYADDTISDNGTAATCQVDVQSPSAGVGYTQTNFATGSISINKANDVYNNLNAHTRTTAISTGQQRTDDYISIDTAGANRTVQLLPAAQWTDQYLVVKKSDSSTFSVTVIPDGAETIDGAASFVLNSPHAAVVLKSTGTDVQVVNDLNVVTPGSTSSNIVFRPGVPSTGNQYATWAECQAVIDASLTYIQVEVDNSHAPAIMSGAALDLHRVIFIGGIAGPTLIVPAGVTWASLPVGVYLNLTIDIQHGGTVGSFTTPQAIILEQGGKLHNSVSATPSFDFGNGAFLYCSMSEDGQIGDGTHPVFRTTNAAAVMNFACENAGHLRDNALSDGGVASTWSLDSQDTAGDMSHTQALATATAAGTVNWHLAGQQYLLNYLVRNVSALTTQLYTDSVISADPTAAGFAINLLPAAQWQGKVLTVENTSSSPNAITITASGAELIDGSPTLVINTALAGVRLLSTGSAIQVISGYQVPQFGWRPTFAYPGFTTTYYVDGATGLDTNPGTNVAPFATIAGALARIPVANSSTVTVNVASGTYAVPLTLSGINFITFQGNVTTPITGTWSNVIAGTDAAGVYGDVQLTGGPYVADQLRGRIIQYTSGPAAGLFGVIYRNDASVGADTRVYCTQGPSIANLNASIIAPVNGNTVAVQQLNTIFQFQGNSTLESSTQANFQDIAFSATATGQSLFIVDTDKPTFLRCSVTGMRRFQAGTAGRYHLDTTYYAPVGLNDAGLLTAVNGGVALIQRGSVVDDANAGANADFISATQNGSISFRNLTAFRGLSGPCIRIEGGNILTDNGVGVEDGILFENLSGAGASNTGNACAVNSGTLSATGAGGAIILPNLHGAVTGNYALTAQKGPTCSLGSTSNLTTALGTNTVSANNGATTSDTNSDGTIIYPATGTAQGWQRRFNMTTAKTADFTAALWDGVEYNASGGTFTITAPPATNRQLGDQFLIKEVANSATAITVSGNGINIEDPSTPGSFVASVSVAAAGVSLSWVCDSTPRWVLV